MSRSADPSDAPWGLLARHLAADASASERTALRAWVQADPRHLQILTTVTRAWERAGEAAATPVLFSPADVEAAWQRFSPLLTPPALPAPAPPVPVARPLAPVAQPWAAGWWPAAAALAVALGGGYLWLSRPAPKPEAVVTYASADHRQAIRLPESSQVWLNAHSRLHYRGLAVPAGQGRRAVQLAGEAYFDVAAGSDQPLLVNTAIARVRATNSAFNVRAYAAEDSVEVSVTSGQVWLVHPAPADSVLLTAGTRAAVRAADAPGRVVAAPHRTAANQNFRAWQTDTLRFQDAPITQVVQTLRATFGTAVAWRTASLGQCRFTGTFAHPRPAQVLAVLAAATASRLRPDGHGGYVLEGAGCAPGPAITPDSAVRAAHP